MASKSKIREIKSKIKIKELKGKIKIKEIEEESEPENVAEEETRSPRFQEFMSSSGRFTAPVLDKIASVPTQTDLEQGVASEPKKTDDENNRRMDYTSRAREATKNLQKYESKMEVPILRPSEEARGFSRVRFSDPLEGMRTTQDAMSPRMLDVGFQERKDNLPFEDEKKKYKSVEL